MGVRATHAEVDPLNFNAVSSAWHLNETLAVRFQQWKKRSHRSVSEIRSIGVGCHNNADNTKGRSPCVKLYQFSTKAQPANTVAFMKDRTSLTPEPEKKNEANASTSLAVVKAQLAASWRGQ